MTYTVTYTDANFSSSTLAAGNVTLNTTGTANASIGVSGSGLTRTVTLSSITGNGTLGITIAAGTATDLVGNSAPASGASTTFTVDNVAPTISIGPPSATLTNTGPVTYSVTYSDTWSLSSTLAPSNITVNATGTAGCTNLSVTGSGTAWTVTLSNLTGTGTLGITIAAGTATDQAGNTAPGAGPSATFAVDNTAPRLTGGEALYVAQAGNNQVTFYDNLSGTPVNHTFASGLNFALGVAIDPSGYVYASYMGAVNKYTAAGGLVSGFGSGGTVSGLGTEVPGITLNQSGSRLVVPCYGQTLVQALDTTTGAAAAGFTSVAMSLPLIAAYNSSQTFLYLGDNGGALERYSINGGTGTTISLTGASGSIVGLLFQDDTHLLVANNSGNTVRRFVLSGTSGTLDPTFGVSGSATVTTAWGLAADSVGNIYVSSVSGGKIAKLSAAGAILNPSFITGLSSPYGIFLGPGGTLTPPTNGYYAAGQNLLFTAPFSKVVNVTGTPEIAFTLGAGATEYAQYVSGSGTSNLLFSYTVQAGDNGALAISSPILLNGGSIADALDNNAILTFAAPTTAGVVADNIDPTVAISGPSTNVTVAGPVSFTVTYADANFASSTLASGNITVIPTGSAACTTVTVTGTGATRTVTLTGITGDGTLGISIAAGTATDLAGNSAGASSASATFAVDNTAPTIALSSPSATLTNTGPVTYNVTYSDLNFNSSTLAAGNITLNTTGTATASVGVSGSGLTRTVTLSSITGNGTLGITIAAGTATDLAGNPAPASGASATFTVDNVAPTIAISPPSATITNTGPITYTVTYADAAFNASTLGAGDVSLDTSGSATASGVAVTGSGLTRTVTLSGITGNGTLGISIAAGTATDLAGNHAPASGASATFVVDNTPPTLTISPPSATITNTGPITYTVTYADAAFNASTLAVGDISLNTSGSATASGVAVTGSGLTRTVILSGITGTGTLGISIAAGTATDLAGNQAPASGASPTLNVDNTPPTLAISAPSTNTTAVGPISFTVTYSDAHSQPAPWGPATLP